MTWEPLDIEELHEIGKKGMICPYFANKDRVTGADIIFMPYNYLIDEKIRENFDIRYENACIIFDEAHNVAQCAEDVTSFELKTKLLEGVVVELQKV
jgi:Rad3-related DNA helicase